MAYTVEGANPTTSPELNAIEKQIGRSNFYRTMALHPAGLSDFFRFYQAVMGPGTLDARTKEMVYFTVSSINECSYCSAHHQTAALAAGVSSAEIDSIRHENDQSFSARERAVLRFARELTRNAAIEDTTRHEIETALSPEQAVELAEVVALANFTNRITAGMKVDLEK